MRGHRLVATAGPPVVTYPVPQRKLVPGPTHRNPGPFPAPHHNHEGGQGHQYGHAPLGAVVLGHSPGNLKALEWALEAPGPIGWYATALSHPNLAPVPPQPRGPSTPRPRAPPPYPLQPGTAQGSSPEVTFHSPPRIILCPQPPLCHPPTLAQWGPATGTHVAAGPNVQER